VIRAHQPGSEPINIPETIPNPVVVPKPTPTPTEPAPKEPVRFPEKVPSSGVSTGRREVLSKRSRCRARIRGPCRRRSPPIPFADQGPSAAIFVSLVELIHIFAVRAELEPPSPLFFKRLARRLCATISK
jgi:hypothetical protein